MATFAGFIAAHDRDERVLVWLEPRLVLTGWTLTPSQSNTYDVAMVKQAGTTAVKGGVYREVIGVRENDTDLTEQSSIATVEATASSWWWDPSAEELYVHTSTGSDPDTFTTIQAIVRFHFATKPVLLEDGTTALYHHPWIAGGLPTLHERDDEDAIGAKLTRRSTLMVINASGWWNAIIAHDGDYRWRNARARFKLGGSYDQGSQVLALADYGDLATMAVTDATAQEGHAVFDLAPLVGTLADQTLPSDPLFESDWPNLGDGVSGTHEWIAYGRATFAPDLVDTLDSEGVWLLPDGSDTAYNVWAVDRSDFTRTLLDPTSPAAEYEQAGGPPAILRIKSATYNWSTHWVEVDLQAPDASGGLRFANIVKSLLIDHMGVRTSDLDDPSFARATELAPQLLSFWIKKPRSVTSLLATAQEGFPSLERSVLGRVGQSSAGTWSVGVWTPGYDADSLPVLRVADFASFLPSPVSRDPVTRVNVYYNARHIRDASGALSPEWSVATATDASIGYEHDISGKTLDVHTFLTRARDAQTLAERVLRLALSTRAEVEFQATGVRNAQSQVNDKTLVTYSPAPCVAGAYDRDVFDFHTLSHTLGPVSTVRGRLTNLRGVTKAGRWQPTSTTAYAGSTAFQRKHRGFWTNDSDEASAGDATSKVSQWW